MAITRRVNWVSQGRVDTPDMRSMESAVSNDFDDLIKAFVTGTVRGYILRGFELSMAGAIGGASNALQMAVDPGAIFHINSSQSGTILLVPSGTSSQILNSAINTIVDGAFVPGAINYVGIEYERYLDSSTAAQIYLWNPTTNNESTQIVPRAQILRFRIKITSTTFASNVLPVAIVTTNIDNTVQSITDSRWMLFRKGQGGTSPNPFYNYPWNAQTEGRVESSSTSYSSGVNPFHGGDKMLGTFKDWMDAIMTSLQEIKGTNYWYSVGTAGSLEKMREDLGNTVTTGVGVISHSATVAGLINWSNDIFMKVVGTKISYKIQSNIASSDITLADDEVAYINLNRDVAVTPNLFYAVSGPNTIVTSIGAVAWTAGLSAGDMLKAASEPDSSYHIILSVDSSTQVTLTGNYIPSGQTASGVQSVYSYGVYYASASPIGDARAIQIADRGDVPVGQNIFWLFLRGDNGGIPRVYIHFLGVELTLGDSQEVDSDIPSSLLNYIGTSLQGLNSQLGPQYVSAQNPGSVPEITDLQIGDSSTINQNYYFYINSSNDARRYYVWFNKDAAGTDPKTDPLTTIPSSYTGIEVNIVTGGLANANAILLMSALNSTLYNDFTATMPSSDTVRVTNKSAGVTIDASYVSIPYPVTITIIQQGTGTGNSIVNDGDNLTLGIKKLDNIIGAMEASLDDPSYNEIVTIVASGATPPTSLNGPITIGTNIILPDNSRIVGTPAQFYTVGNGVLQVFLNGQSLVLDTDWSEVGSNNTASQTIEILQQLEVGDELEFRVVMGGAGFGVEGPEGQPGPQGLPGVDALYGPVAISTKIADYSVQLADNVLLADCTGGNIQFTLPSPASAVGRVFFLKKIDGSANTMSIISSGGALIDGSGSQSTAVQYYAFMCVTDGTSWWLL